MRPQHFPLLALGLALAACGSSEGNNTSAGGDEAAGAAAVATVQEAVPDNLADDPQNTAVPIGPAPTATPAGTPAAATAPGTFPAAYQGRWGMVPNDCDPAQDFAAKGLMTIEASRVSFYESRATPSNVRAVGAGGITADLAFSGEGQRWTQGVTMTLLDGGKTLVREVTRGDDLGVKGAQRYSKCPA